jgi:hypothetical protein
MALALSYDEFVRLMRWNSHLAEGAIMSEDREKSVRPINASAANTFASSQEQVTHLAEENARLKEEMQRLTELWERDRVTMVALIVRRFPTTKEELQAALDASEPFSKVLDDLFPEHCARA